MLPNGFFMRYVVIQRDMFAMLTRFDIIPVFAPQWRHITPEGYITPRQRYIANPDRDLYRCGVFLREYTAIGSRFFC